MPYIKKQEREALDDRLDEFLVTTEGELAYCISSLISGYMQQHAEGYRSFAAVVGVLDSMKMEFYRRVIVPYEDKKIQENGDVQWS